MRLTTLVHCVLFSLVSSLHIAAQRPAIPRDEQIERQVEQTLARLSLDEKIGQMCELTIDVITDGQSRDFRLNEDALQKVFARYHVGSILNVPKGLAQRPEVWSTLIRRLNRLSAEHCSELTRFTALHILGVPRSSRRRLARQLRSTDVFPAV